MKVSVTPYFSIPDKEIQMTYARSSGAGGQNVNKTSTKVILRWSVRGSRVLTWEQKIRVRSKLVNRINSNDEVVILSEEERSQLQNRFKAKSRLDKLVTMALRVPKKRRLTQPTYSSKIKRLDSKKLHSRAKTARRAIK
ncbi:MAG: hypothetical protein A2538_04315 [Candidatus Magasanikbacteria bacterium RIFOXYD2_FULL_41_14]|uniref:Prokaryotic-type class I peptide chain release factors domain-containing protein n=1 Tax=Candidatus Magasanikbacteria bacterium RIFOXYD2_FULL_41_14 TaxID=1798709 RepID=A0A1F6PES5_9BACT|nr:MAG: hypothetical protein A2538_04315 [Candidatus Magasanikbacteria bacterium RIFOXYD2_FULL_41_14]